MDNRGIVFANAARVVLSAHGATRKDSERVTGHACPNCRRAALFVEVIKVNSQRYHYEMDVARAASCGAPTTIRQ